MTNIIAYFHVKDGALEQVRALAEELVAKTRQEDGCVRYDMNRSLDDPNYLVMIESWRDAESLAAHGKSEHFTRLVPQIRALCEDPKPADRFEPYL